MLKLGLSLADSGKSVRLPMDLILEAEALGFDSVWTSESYGPDAVTTASWILAQTRRIRVGTRIMQMPARSPAMAAMTAMTLDQLSGGRFIAGLGPSGPQVVEGWHGVRYTKPITHTREYVAIMRQIMRRESPLTFEGEIYQLPVNGGTELGKPLKSILRAAPSIPIYTAAITPTGLAVAAEVADGVFPIWMSPERFSVLSSALDKGFARRDRPAENFDVAPTVIAVMGEDSVACREPVKRHLALYIGGMGSRNKNFYKDYAARMGYSDAAHLIQDRFLAGDREGAAAAVPDDLVDEIALVGPESCIRERASVWREAGQRGEVGTLLISTQQAETLALLADCLL